MVYQPFPFRQVSLRCSPFRLFAKASGTPTQWPHPFAHRRVSKSRWKSGTNAPAVPGRIPWEGHCHSSPWHRQTSAIYDN